MGVLAPAFLGYFSTIGKIAGAKKTLINTLYPQYQNPKYPPVKTSPDFENVKNHLTENVNNHLT